MYKNNNNRNAPCSQYLPNLAQGAVLRPCRIGNIHLGKIDQEALKTILMLGLIKKLNNCCYNQQMPVYPSQPYPQQPQIIVIPTGSYGFQQLPAAQPAPQPAPSYGNYSNCSGVADEVKEYIYNQTLNYRDTYQRNMDYIANEFRQLKEMINRR